ncbi:unnamed protein product [Effrenium voratum]|uniref:Uncharacterized protein n=1 Tax=Effrenium voratum TaxID=2562239 RepID=A0AA36I1C3_9DINO|nr:unnamed protein product [Effrenium voratum]
MRVVADFVAALSMPRDSGQRLLSLSFQDEEQQEAEEQEPAVVSGCLDRSWLGIVAPLYSTHMGCENMGPLLYSLLRFVKPSHCLEVGAGYTSAFLLQALEDNFRELQLWKEMPKPNWLVEREFDDGPGQGVLHCVDNFAHEHSTAPLLSRVAEKLGLQHRLRLHLDDGRAFLEESSELVPHFDFVWLDGLLDFAPPKKGDVRAPH